jgi:hypothetical protein
LMLFGSLVFGACSFSSHAQSPLSNLVFAVGTTWQDNGNNQWSYILLDSSDGSVLAGRRFAVFGKLGNAGSANPFTQRGTMFRQTDATAINTLLNQAVSLGEDLSGLGNALNLMFHSVPGITNQTLAQKVVSAFQFAASDPPSDQLLALMGKGHPGLNLCLGHAFSEQISSVTTYELRELDPTAGTPGDVVGRVTVVPGSPVALPAPGRPFQVVTNDPSDHLRVRLRWGSPPDLRRLSPLQFGYNVWRIARTNAEAGNFQITPPTIAQLYGNPNFLRANAAPVMPSAELDLGTGLGGAENLADRLTYFFADTGRMTGGEFTDGQEFYYFITARDILGRDGQVSFGGLARACRRLPPSPPSEVRVENAVLPGSTNLPRLLVTWEQNTNPTNAVTEYWVYRWVNPAMALTNDAAPTNGVIAIVPQLAGTNLNSFLDDTTSALKDPNLTNVWYTLRAVSQAACDPLLSPHSPPAWGVLRDRTAPDATEGEVLGSCGAPGVILNQVLTNALTGTNVEGPLSRVVCVRRDPGIEWAELFIGSALPIGYPYGGGDVPYFNRIYFPPNGDRIEIEHALPLLPSPALYITCKVGNAYGSESATLLYSHTNAYPNNSELQVEFLAGQLLATALSSSDPLVSVSNCVTATSATPDSSGMVAVQFPLPPLTTALVQAQTNGVNWNAVALLTSDSNGVFWVSYPACLIGPVPPFRACQVNLSSTDCDQHVASAAATGPTAPIRVRFKLKPRTREYRVYRRVDSGPLTLLAQGAADYDPLQPNKILESRDETMPSVAARICYFVQLLNRHGAGSPLALIGCKQVKPAQLPVPTLSEPIAAGDTNQPQVALNWFCPTSGVYRFQFKLQLADSQGGTQQSGFASPKLARDLTFNTAALFAGLSPKKTFLATLQAGGAFGLLQFDEAHLTSPVGANFGPGPLFTLTASVRANTSYLISVAAVDEQGKVGPSSTAWEFTWRPPVVQQTVPWPARPLPHVSEDINGAMVIDTTNLYPRYPVGVVIGGGQTTSLAYSLGVTNTDYVPGQPPARFIGTTADGRPLLPAVLYRMQVTNALFPRVSGDLVQCSPLIETIAWRNPCLSGTFDGPCTESRLRDPLIRSLFYALSFDEFTYYSFRIILLDTQPVISGARYRYSLVRFDSKREPDTIIPCGEVDIP